MVDVSLIAGAISGLKAASGMASDLVAVRDHAVLQSKVIELQRTILDAQASALAAQGGINELQETVRDLRVQLAAAEGWAKVADRYHLQKFHQETFVYELSSDKAQGQPVHMACPVCFEKQSRSILQRWSEHANKVCYKCFSCENMYWMGQRIEAN